jgi:hypothetical protein
MLHSAKYGIGHSAPPHERSFIDRVARMCLTPGFSPSRRAGVNLSGVTERRVWTDQLGRCASVTMCRGDVRFEQFLWMVVER